MIKAEQITRLTILVAEDDPDDRLLMKEAFRAIGDDTEL